MSMNNVIKLSTNIIINVTNYLDFLEKKRYNVIINVTNGVKKM